MPIAVHFQPPALTAEQYDEVIRRLRAAGAGTPDGRLYSVCHGAGSHLRVFDLWESVEQFAAFGEVLTPILVAMQLDPGTPEITPVHAVVDPRPPLVAI
jgi:hypothetical protein